MNTFETENRATYEAEASPTLNRIIRDPRLSAGEKRALLAACASDAKAIADEPTLRMLDDGTIVPVEVILRAIRSLDRDAGVVRLADCRTARFGRGSLLSRLRVVRPRRDDDDDPPPCPASAAIPMAPSRVEAVAAA